MTKTEFLAAVAAAETYEEAHEIVLAFVPDFRKLTRAEQGECRRAWKPRKAELRAAE